MLNFKFPAINLWNFPRKREQKISFRIDPLSANIRFYTKPIKANLPLVKEHTEWYKILTVQMTDTGEVHFSGVKEGLTRTEYKLLFDYFKSKGYKEGYYRHKNKEFFVDLTKKKFNLVLL